MKKSRLAILASGSGSNAEAIMLWAQKSDLADVVCVISNKKQARVLERARDLNVAAEFVSKKLTDSKDDYDKKLLERLKKYQPDWIVLAGYMRLLTAEFLNHYPNKVINIHPSLLPLFPGTDGYGEAFQAKVHVSGCTIHYVDEGVDTGKIIAQKEFPLSPADTLEDFKKRGLAVENQFYPEVIEKLLRGQL